MQATGSIPMIPRGQLVINGGLGRKRKLAQPRREALPDHGHADLADWRRAVGAPPRPVVSGGGRQAMGRSAVREIQVSGISVQRGEVLVPTQIGDPVHGLLACPAAPLVAASLRARTGQVRLAGLPRCDDESGDFDALLFLVTCPQQDGSTAAIAAAAAPGDARCAAFARSVVAEWAAVCASRTLLMGG